VRGLGPPEKTICPEDAFFDRLPVLFLHLEYVEGFVIFKEKG